MATRHTANEWKLIRKLDAEQARVRFLAKHGEPTHSSHGYRFTPANGSIAVKLAGALRAKGLVAKRED